MRIKMIIFWYLWSRNCYNNDLSKFTQIHSLVWKYYLKLSVFTSQKIWWSLWIENLSKSSYLCNSNYSLKFSYLYNDRLSLMATWILPNAIQTETLPETIECGPLCITVCNLQTYFRIRLHAVSAYKNRSYKTRRWILGKSTFLRGKKHFFRANLILK